jgi:hypothetical protein
VVLALGHQGQKCPCDATGADRTQWEEEELSDDSEGDYTDAEPGMFTETRSWQTGIDASGNRVIVAVDISGVHNIAVRWCECPGAPAPDIQLFEMGLFPASFQRIRTAFTFRCLDDFLLENVECKTAAMNYYSKLRRSTSDTFPQTVPVCPQQM